MLDAHLWLLPANARTIAARMAEDLAQVDPANAGRYRANLKAFEERLGGLDGKLRERLGKLAGKPFFVFHEAFDYFEEAYGCAIPACSRYPRRSSREHAMSPPCAPS